MGKNMGKVASSYSSLVGSPLGVQRRTTSYSAVRRSESRLNAPDRLNLKEVPLRELNLMA